MTIVPQTCTEDQCAKSGVRRGLCWAHYGRLYRSTNPESSRAANKKYYEKNKEKLQEGARARATDWYHANQEAGKERSRLWAEANPDKVRAYRIGKQARRRARAQDSGVEYYTELDIVELYGTDCHICLEAIDMDAPRACGAPGWERSFWRDHFIAIANGGPDTLSNIRPSHGLCNLRKGASPS